MKILSKLNLFAVLFLIVLSTGSLAADKLEYSIISEGYIDDSYPAQSLRITESQSLSEFMEKNKIAAQDNNLDFNKDAIVLLIPDGSYYPDQININKVIKTGPDQVEVEYTSMQVPHVSENGIEKVKPFVVLNIENAGGKDKKLSFKNVTPNRPVIVNQSLEEEIKYTNVLEQHVPELFISYLPLDKGNTWTYDVESGTNRGQQTFSIVSYTNGWSVFDNFFGKSNVAMKLDPSGNLYVSSQHGIKPFYTDDVKISTGNAPYKLGPRSFDEVLIVTSSDNSPIEFKDVYAKDIGLIYHEHTSSKGTAKYSLSNATVRGRGIP